MSIALQLMSFDELTDAPETSGPSADYLKGFEDGAAAAKAVTAKENDQLNAETVAAISELSFGYHEAKHLFAASLRPLFQAISDRIVPMVMHETLGHQLIDILEQESVKAMTTPITIALAPEDFDRFSPLFTDKETAVLNPVSSDQVSIGHAMITNGVRSIRFNPDDLTDAIRMALMAITEHQQNEVMND